MAFEKENDTDDYTERLALTPPPPPPRTSRKAPTQADVDQAEASARIIGSFQSGPDFPAESVVELNPAFEANDNIPGVVWSTDSTCARTSLYFKTKGDIRRLASAAFPNQLLIRNEYFTTPPLNKVVFAITAWIKHEDGSPDSAAFNKISQIVENVEGVRLRDVVDKGLQNVEAYGGKHYSREMTWDIDFPAWLTVQGKKTWD